MKASLAEKYRPASFDDMAGNSKAIAQLRRIGDNGIGGRAVWISGPSSTGKTTAARILANTIADRWAIVEVDAGSLTAEQLREWQNGCYQFGWGKGGKVFILNEAHGLRSDLIRRLLVWLEELPGHVAVIFTTTIDGMDKLFDDQIDASPLLSRCLAVRFSNQGIAEPFAERALQIARAEGLDGQPLSEYVKLIRRCKSNLRMALQEIEAGCMIGGES